jgi:hypothetical protein
MGWIAGIGFGIAISGFFLCQSLGESGKCVFSVLLESPLISVVIPVFQILEVGVGQGGEKKRKDG